ncbi:MAG: putative thioredoxin [Rhodospirillaceae bacterium]|nr:MAG: putative thioredoxin [Rhodospirillaceae bacterium]
MEQDRINPEAVAGVMECRLVHGDTKTVTEMLKQLPANLLTKSEIVAIKTRLELAAEAMTGKELRTLQKVVETNPDDHQARYDLAMACYVAGDRRRAVEELLEIMRRNRSWNDDGARRQLVRLFEAFGPTDPLTVQSRRRLSSIMFS